MHRAMGGGNAPEWPRSKFANRCNCFFPHRCRRCVLGIAATPDWQTNKLYIHMLCQILDIYSQVGERVTYYVVSMHYVGLLVALPCPCVMCHYAILVDARVYTVASSSLLSTLAYT